MVTQALKCESACAQAPDGDSDYEAARLQMIENLNDPEASFLFAEQAAAAGDVDGATFTQIDATHWLIVSADGQTRETITLANGATISPDDYIFKG